MTWDGIAAPLVVPAKSPGLKPDRICYGFRGLKAPAPSVKKPFSECGYVEGSEAATDSSGFQPWRVLSGLVTQGDALGWDSGAPLALGYSLLCGLDELASAFVIPTLDAMKLRQGWGTQFSGWEEEARTRVSRFWVEGGAPGYVTYFLIRSAIFLRQSGHKRLRLELLWILIAPV
jgi:hypothetical protein